MNDKLDKLIIGNKMESTISRLPDSSDRPRLLMSSKTVINEDGSKDYVATCVSSDILNAHRDPKIKGVVLRQSTAPDAEAQIKEASGGKTLDELLDHADDETYALDARNENFALDPGVVDKGVIAEIIPDDHVPSDDPDVQAGILIPSRRGMTISRFANDMLAEEDTFPNALGPEDFDGDSLYYYQSPHATIPLHAKPKTRINRQRQGYSRRKAKRAFQARAAHRVKLTRYKRRSRAYLLMVDEQGNPVNLKSNIHIAQAMGRGKDNSNG